MSFFTVLFQMPALLMIHVLNLLPDDAPVLLVCAVIFGMPAAKHAADAGDKKSVL